MRTPQGWEMQFATNHLGHFALATGLHDALASAHGARIVSVSSTAHLRSPVVFDDIHFREYVFFEILRVFHYVHVDDGKLTVLSSGRGDFRVLFFVL